MAGACGCGGERRGAEPEGEHGRACGPGVQRSKQWETWKYPRGLEVGFEVCPTVGASGAGSQGTRRARAQAQFITNIPQGAPPRECLQREDLGLLQQALLLVRRQCAEVVAWHLKHALKIRSCQVLLQISPVQACKVAQRNALAQLTVGDGHDGHV